MKVKNKNYKSELQQFKKNEKIINDIYVRKEIEWLFGKENFKTDEECVKSLNRNVKLSLWRAMPRDENNEFVNPNIAWVVAKNEFICGLVFFICIGILVPIIFIISNIQFKSFDNLENITFIILFFLTGSILFIYTSINLHFRDIKYKTKWTKILAEYKIYKPKKYLMIK